MQKLDTNTDGLCPIGISPRVTKQLQHFATITYGYTNEICPVGILPRVAKILQPLPQSLMRFPMKLLMDGAHSNACDYQTTWSVITVTKGITDRRGKSNALVL